MSGKSMALKINRILSFLAAAVGMVVLVAGNTPAGSILLFGGLAWCVGVRLFED
jgi:hypothetical protein